MKIRISELGNVVEKLTSTPTNMSVMIWGAPGIGKSSVVRNVANTLGIDFKDVRLGQLAPTDLRGLPIFDTTDDHEVMKWVAPNFLPRDKNSKGILFLDEFNMASGSMMGIAQQLVLDRRVGDYILPDGWTIIAAGNRATDRAAISIMPAPVANRFIHFHAYITLDDFKSVAYATFPKNGIETDDIGKVLGFLNFKPELLNVEKIKSDDIQFPTPRSWENALKLMSLGLDPEPAIGESTTIQFRAYLRLFQSLPNLESIVTKGDKSSEKLNAKSKNDPSIIYAIISGLISKSSKVSEYMNSLNWILSEEAITQDYIGLFLSESMTKLKSVNSSALPEFAQKLISNPKTADFISEYKSLVVGFGV